MPDDRNASEEPTPIEEDPTDSFDLAHPERVQVGVTRGETDLEMGPPRDYPDRADVSVRPESDEGHRVIVSVDAMAGDHGTGHADVALTPAEARALRDQLDETVRWMTEDGREGATESARDTDGEPDHDGH
ncbi:hypothetical protein [Natrinema halophilum]|uniref:Uncharacterized protein n=1 Tax=Natrinema halophilum TaxID=1699371 RepID=A0A7D5KD67_9EURY|nr:hypothetical protein [Natrinema halophilum]QLG49176.1 hypothetical protein HYG82_10070 [Natrinema halophilum]